MTCPRCCAVHARAPQRYCWDCHAAYMREWRKSNRLAGEARRRDLARSTANTYQARGVLVLEPCEDCGSTDRIEKHHEDYSRPLDVVFLCRTCHLARHHRVDRRAISRETASQAEAA